MGATMNAEKMAEFLYSLPEQFQQSVSMEINIPESYYKKHSSIVVTGLGGSAIGGDILKSYAFSQANLPVVVNRDYHIPAFVDSNTLFFAVSYSGNTEETLNAYEEAVAKGAAIICITSGGKLSEWAKRDGNVVIKVPSGLVPRAAVGYLFAPLALVMEKLALVHGATAELEETAKVLRQLRAKINPDIDITENKARIIAGQLKDSLPIIWGTTNLTETAVLRWKAQLNENAKCPAYYNVFPELNHNEIVGFEAPADLIANTSIIMLQDYDDGKQIKKRMAVTADIIKDKVKNIIEVNSEGNSFLARFFSLIYLGDYVSFYLALEYGINPTPVEVIDYLKEELGK